MKKYRISVRDVNTELYESGLYEAASADEVTKIFMEAMNTGTFLRFPNGSAVAIKYIVSFRIAEVKDAE
jgi:hypothetical protein